jgi:hypothetical protein
VIFFKEVFVSDSLVTLVRSGSLEAAAFGVDAGAFGDLFSARCDAFVAAAEVDAVDAFLFFLDRWGFDGSDGMTPLGLAALLDAVGIAEALLGRGFSWDADDFSMLPIVIGTSEGSLRVTELLVRAGAGGRGMWFLEEAVLRRSVGLLRLFLGCGADVRGVCSEDFPGLLHEACDGVDSDEDLEVVRLLLEAGCDPNAFGGEFWVGALGVVHGVRVGDAVRLLVGGGADVNGVSGGGSSVLGLQALGGNVEVVELLVGLGADVGFVSRAGRSVLLSAVAGVGGFVERVEVVRFLLDCGVVVGDDVRDAVLLGDGAGGGLRVLLEAGFVVPDEWLVFAGEYPHVRELFRELGVVV